MSFLYCHKISCLEPCCCKLLECNRPQSQKCQTQWQREKGTEWAVPGLPCTSLSGSLPQLNIHVSHHSPPCWGPSVLWHWREVHGEKPAPIPLPPLFLLLPQQQQSTGAVKAEKELHFESSFFLTSTRKMHLVRTSGKNESFKDCTCMSEKVYKADLGIYYLISFF